MRIFLFSPIPFSFLHQRPQKIAEEFTRQSVAVTFIEPYGFTEIFAGRKKFRVQDIIATAFYHSLALWDLIVRRRPRMPRGDGSAEETNRDKLEILTLPLIISSNRMDSRFLDRLNSAVLRRWLTRTIPPRKSTGRSVALVQQPYFGSVLEKSDFDQLCYDCIDDLSVFSGHGSRERLSSFEDSLMDMADAVFVTSSALNENLERKRPGIRTVRIPNGVDYERFQEIADTLPPPPELGVIRKPVVGYVGILRAWFDAVLLETLARENPAVTFVLVGPSDDTAQLRQLKRYPNIILTGRKPYNEIPTYICSFDICLIPFRRGEIAETTNPVKVFEYFALGKPVISTWLRELIPYAERGLLSMAKTHEEFSESLRHILEAHDDSKEADRRAVARENSWSAHVHRMITVLHQQEPKQ